MIVEVEHFLVLLLIVCVYSDFSCDLAKSEDIGDRRELDVHYVLVEVNIRRLVLQTFGIVSFLDILCGKQASLITSFHCLLIFYR